MTRTTLALAIAIPAIAVPAFCGAAPSPSPKQSSHKVFSPYPTAKLHTEFVVEVNAKGQVVRVKSGKSTRNLTYNAQTYGNVLQMWIRRPDGSAVVGLYRVTYDYDPGTHHVRRWPTLLKTGGNWGNKEGAANDMIDVAKRQARAHPQATLPPLNVVTVKPTPHR